MKCPRCGGGNVFVLDSRAKEDTVRRRRKCSDCGTRFSTVEIPAEEYANLVKAKHREESLRGMVEGDQGNGGT